MLRILNKSKSRMYPINSKLHSSSISRITFPKDPDFSWDYDMQSVDSENLIPPQTVYNITEIKSPVYNKNLNDIYQAQLTNLHKSRDIYTQAERNHQQLVKLLENNSNKISIISSILINNSKKK